MNTPEQTPKKKKPSAIRLKMRKLDELKQLQHEELQQIQRDDRRYRA